VKSKKNNRIQRAGTTLTWVVGGSLVAFVTAKDSCARQDIKCTKEAENSLPGSSKFKSESVWLSKLQSQRQKHSYKYKFAPYSKDYML